ncbi:zinc-binding dehydrogenase [Cohnella sp. GCM10020058]|uniref:zinc-dependent alcohol dehydrogenase n=1 Tax=Cohnella sp. GCM10020058 TaxID=3317330 RepID=UPI003634C67C
MKSRAVYFRGNRQLELREIEVPDPNEDEIQVKTLVNGICMMEVWQYNLKEPYWKEGILAGHEGVGLVTKAGRKVNGLKEGDYVWTGNSSWSERLNLKEGHAVKLNCTPENAENYVIEPLSCAVTAAAYLNVYPGDRVILFGAGYMGLLLTQLLARSPLSELIVVDLKKENLELAASFGATETIQMGEPGAEERLAQLEAHPFDITIEGSGAEQALASCTKLARAGGKVGIYAWHHQHRTVDTSAWHTKGLQILNVAPGITSNDMPYRQFYAAEKLIRAGVVRQDVLFTHRYSLDDVERAMNESTLRGQGFIKSMLVF